MTQTFAKLKIVTPKAMALQLGRPRLQLKAQLRIPAGLVGKTGISIADNAGVLTAVLSLLPFNTVASFDPSGQSVLLVDANGNYTLTSVATLLNNTETTEQLVTAGGDVVVGVNTRLLIMNRAVDINPSNIILPAANLKIGSLKIVDFKGNATAFPHTIKTTAPDTFQGGVTQWGLAADGASIEISPIPGTGYAV